MEFLRTLASRAIALFRRRSLEKELEAELQSHVEMAVEKNIRKGMDLERAKREALLEFGGVEQTKELYRERRGLPMIETAWHDLRFGLRMLWRSPNFSILVILCLTLGIGANAAIFSWIEGVLFRPYPAVAHQERLVAISGTAPGEARGTPLSWPDFLDLQRQCTLFDTFFVTKITGTTLSVGDRAERATGSIVSANYFDAIGVHPILGRGFEPGEDMGRNTHPVVVISYQLWKGRFNGDPEIVGKTQRLNGVMHTIVGVTPEGFYGTFVGWAMQFWVPASMEEIFESDGYKLEDRGARWIESYARLNPGVTAGLAQQEVSAVAKRLETDYPTTNRGRNIKLWPLWQTPFNNAATLLPTLETMLVVGALVLLIACANVANLLLVKSFARRHEMTVRIAIGAGQSRLLKQLFTEGLILSLLGAAGGLLVAFWSRKALALLLPVRAGVSMHLPGDIDWRVLGLTAGVSLAATLLLGLVPSIQNSKIDLAGALKADSAGVVGGGGKAWVRSSLVLAQVSLSFVLLVGAALLLQSLQKIRNTSPGFLTQGVLDTAVDLVSAGYDAPRAKTFQDALVDRVAGLPGVESVAFARGTPLGYRGFSSSPIEVDGYQPPLNEVPAVEYNEVGPSYFQTVGIPLVSGREFVRADDENAALVAVVNQTMVARYWRGRDPLGERLKVKGRWMTVVGVAKDSKYNSVRELPTPFFYVPWRQNFSVGGGFHIRTSLPPQTMATALAREIHALDPGLAPFEIITMQEQLERSTSAQKVAVTLVGILGGLAVLLAAIGLYGVMSYAVSQSTRELGLRMALGAGESNLLRLVMSRGLGLTAGGVLLGTVAALTLTRLLGNLLYKVSPRDPLAFGSALVIMLIVAIAACFLPAWRAAQTDPARALRD
jgi:macrolide transport system ATP-binding/permease protein